MGRQAPEVPRIQSADPEVNRLQTFVRQTVENLRAPQEAWKAPTLANGWTNFGGGHSPAGYYKDSNGRVWVRAVLGNSVGVGAGAAFFTLSTGYRPAYRMVFVGWDAAANIAERIDVDTSGNVLLFGAAGAGDIQCFNFSFDTR